MPGKNLGQCIGAGYEVQIQVFAPLSAQVAERVRGIGRPWSVDVHAADRKPGVGRGGNDGHQITIFAG